MSLEGKLIASSFSLVLDLPPSCLEFSPGFPEYFLVGTYNLQKEEETRQEAEEDHVNSNDSSSTLVQKRNGSIVVFRLEDGVATPVHTESRPSAILDLHFQSITGKQDICGVVSSTGTLDIFKFSGSSTSSHVLSSFTTTRIPGIGEDVLFLSFAWHPSLEDIVAISTSEGNIYILRLGEGYQTSQVSDGPIIKHSLEAWCVAMSPIYPDHMDGGDKLFTLMTGGDDSALQYLTCNMEEQVDDDSPSKESLPVDVPFSPITVRGHGAGVTAILFLPLPLDEPEDMVVTGSYDDHLRIYSVAPLHRTGGVRRATLLSEVNLGGGVWRLKLIRIDSGGENMAIRALVLASCMHAGARLVELRRDAPSASWKVQVLARFEEHKSMNYASDCLPGNASDDLVCVSSSFYDKLLCVWKFQAKG